MPTDIPVRSWREIWLGWLSRLPMSDHPIEPEISAEAFVHNAPGQSPAVKAPTSAPASGLPESR